jgi:hypothetical protein
VSNRIQNVSTHYKENSRIHEDLNKIEKFIIMDEIVKFGDKDINELQNTRFERYATSTMDTRRPNGLQTQMSMDQRDPLAVPVGGGGISSDRLKRRKDLRR